MRRWTAALCAGLLCLGLFFSSTQAAETMVYQMVINDKFADGEQINPNTMPIRVDNTIYVAYTVFDKDSTGVRLGTAAGTRKENGLYILTIYNREITLYFEINSGACSDSRGNQYDMRAVMRNNMIFVPAYGTCDLLGLDYSYIPVPIGESHGIVRITNGSQALSNTQFLDSARTSLERRYNNYLRSLEPQTSPTPSTTPAPTPSVTPGGEADHSDVSVYLAFRCEETGGVETILDTLARSGISALFLFRPEDLSGNDALIRRIVGEGHSLGLIAATTTAPEALAELEEGNRLLERICWQRAHVAYADGAVDGVRAELEAQGWRCWLDNVDGTSNGQGTAEQVNRIRNALERLNRKQVRITMDGGATTASALPRVLERLRLERYSIRLAVESQI